MTPPVIVKRVSSNGHTLYADVAFCFGSKRLTLRAARLRWVENENGDFWDLSFPKIKVPGGAVESADLPRSWEKACIAAILEAAEAEGIAA